LNTAATVQALRDRDPTQFFEPSVQTFYTTMKSVDIQLQKAHLTNIEHAALQEKVQAEGKRKVTLRQSIHKGGLSATIDELQEQKKARDKKEASEKLQKARKKLSQAMNQAKKDLNTLGIQARKDEKARLQQLKDCCHELSQ
jgi:D-alanyl-D-alanine dipeptidase